MLTHPASRHKKVVLQYESVAVTLPTLAMSLTPSAAGEERVTVVKPAGVMVQGQSKKVANEA